MVYDRATLMPRIIDAIEDGKSLRDIAKMEGMPKPSTIVLWAEQDPEYAEQYARAMEIRHEMMAAELLDIADHASNDWMEANDPDNPGYRLNGEHIQRSRLRVDTRKWLLSKLAAKKYGDRVEMNVQGNLGIDVTVAEQAQDIRAKLRATDNS